MRRDLGLIRELLLKLEAYPVANRDVVVVTPEYLPVEGYSNEQIEYHLALIQERGLVEPSRPNSVVGIAFTRLSWEGHDFLDAVRDPEIWRKTKAGAEAVGSTTFEFVKEMAKGFIRMKLVELGVPI